MSERVAIISDTHLGTPGARLRSAADLAPLWRGCSELIINGDVAEVHHPDWRADAAREVVRLQQCCEADGVKLTLLSGNHDPMLSDTRFHTLGGGTVLVMHGDAVHIDMAPWALSAARLRRAHEAALAALSPAERRDLRARLQACQHAALVEWLEPDAREGRLREMLRMIACPWVGWKVLRTWREFPRDTANFAAVHAPDARFIVVGHVHRPSIAEFDDRVVINTGSFQIPGPPRMVIVEQGRLAVFAVRRRRGRYEAAPRPLRTYPLFAPDPAEGGVVVT